MLISAAVCRLRSCRQAPDGVLFVPISPPLPWLRSDAPSPREHLPRNQLWRHYLRCVEQVRPKIFVIENVPPLLKSAEYQELLKIAIGLGYRVEGRVLNAADYGVPQTRKRAIVIGSRIGAPRAIVPGITAFAA